MGRALSSLVWDENRPIPAPPTHMVLIEILNRDLTIKRLTVYYNPNDAWDVNECFSLDNTINIGKHIAENSHFVNYDESVLCWGALVIELETQTILHRFKNLGTRERV
ncbi:hypothetical protein [Sphingobacterium sp.]|uniref:hypothetical protein n=1 Tax=Sphingobacterium sp. TaxID=341027 RepID=UPI00289EA347|nr:hypothetical protein [Sphingobacterium sp.]